MTLIDHHESAILSRVIDPQRPGFTAEGARSILTLTFGSDDVARMNELSEKASDGTLTADEQDELDCYERVGHLLAILQAKARQSLGGASNDSPA